MRTLLATLLATLALPTAAPAASLEYVPERCSRAGCDGKYTIVRAAPGEQNRVSVTPEAGGVRITDAGAALTGDCAPQRNTALCPPGGVIVFLGDGDDRLTGARSGHGDAGDDVIDGAAYARGGMGDDRLTAPVSTGRYTYFELYGDEGDDVLVGSGGRDHVEPGPGRDVVFAGGGDDAVYDDDPAPGADELDGGPGSDVLSLYPRSTGATIDLRGQSTSDGDVVRGFEDAAGGAGDDLLIGHEGDNKLYGEAGEDTLLGGGGNDWLVGGVGFDTYDGGAGYDQIFASSPGADYDSLSHGHSGIDPRDEPIACGDGFDDVQPFGDVVGPDCERIFRSVSPRPVRVAGRRVTFRVPCVTLRPCRGTLRVQETPTSYRSSPVPRSRFTLRRRTGRVTVRLADRYCRCRGYEISATFRQGPERTTIAWQLPAVR